MIIHDTVDPPQPAGVSSDLSFAHLVEQGWNTDGEVFDSGNTSETAVEDFSKFHLQQTGFEGESDDADCHYNTADSWQEAESQGPGVDARHAPNSSTGVHLGSTGRSEQVIVANISACVEAAYSMLPFSPPKPIWEQGVWADIFGNGQFLGNSWTTCGLNRPPLLHLHQEHTGLAGDLNPKVKVRKLTDGSCTHADIVVHKTDQTWQEERESILQNALKRWLVVCTYFNAKSIIRVQLDCAFGELDKLNLLADVFRGRAPSTLLKRVRAVEKMCKFFGIGSFPPTEGEMYSFCVSERNLGAPPSRLRSFMEALNFCRHILSMEELGSVVNSRRCVGTTSSDVPHVVAQAEPLKVEELKLLHNVLQTGSSWDKVFAGAILFATYARARWADLMHTDQILIDRDDGHVIVFLEALTSTHKTMRSSVFRHRFLPLTAPGTGVTPECWAELWLSSREHAGLSMPPKHVVMPAPGADGAPSMRPLTSTEASQWLRKLLTGCKDVSKERKVSIHSCKATCLSYCAKFGLDAITRLQLGYHTGGDSGLRMVHTYSRDALAEPLAKLVSVLTEIRSMRFRPDCTRSGRFSASVDAAVPVVAGPMSNLDREVRAVDKGPGSVVDLVSEKEESEDTSGAEVSSSSDESSEEEFQEEQKQLRLFLPPVPPPGYVFWQHSKMKTLHLALPEYKKVFMCNRSIGQFHVNTNMSIRYDTPVCRLCASATKDG